MTIRTLGTIIAFAVSPLTTASAQSAVGGLHPGSRVRFEVSERPGCQSGRFVALDGDRLVVEHRGTQTAFDLSDVTTLQTKTRSGRGALIGAAIGTGTALLLTALTADAARGSDVMSAATLGGLVGAAWGSGQTTRVAGGIGLISGVLIGFLATESGCPGGSAGNCYRHYGAVLVGAAGLLVGTGIGFLLPNWVSLPLDGLRLGASPAGDNRFTISLSVRL